MKWRVLITCSQLQQTIDGYRDVFAERGIEIELPHVEQQLYETDFSLAFPFQIIRWL